MRFARPLRLAWLCAGLLLTALPAVAQTAVTLRPDQMRAAVGLALEQRDDATALRLAEALLQRDPQDVFALIAKSRAARNLGQYDTARAAGRAAWQLAETENDRYFAALSVAQALSSAGARTRAQLWLRRAAQVAPSDTARALAVRDFRYVRGRNPWSTQLSFGITPSSNVNNGSKSDTIDIGGLSFILSGDARALSGIEYRFGLQSEYRRRVQERTWLFVSGALDTKSYSLSSEARAQAPDLDSGDLAYQEAQLTFGGTTFVSRATGPTTLSTTFGKAWSGGAHLADYLRLQAQQGVRLGQTGRLRFSLSAEEQWRKDYSINDSTTWTAEAAWSRRLPGGGGLQLGLGLRDAQSDGPAIAHDARIATVTYNHGKPVVGAWLGVSLSYEARQYDQPLYGTSARADDKTTLRLTAFFAERDYYGFAPEIALKASRNLSNVSLYENEEYGVSIGVRSAF
ncbi:hypothetical protein JT55_01760 [Rhodovulum sp. NI22]|nr:hypothetical protein JT55_01760 [Rhodovulum sp. NI22]